MKKILFILTTNLFLIACSASENKIEPVLKHEEFFGFEITDISKRSGVSLTGYEFQTVDGKNISINRCKQAITLNVANIAEFDYFRFNLLLLSCNAFDKYTHAKASKTSYFPTEFKADFFSQLPADVTPLINSTDKSQRQNKTLLDYDKNTKTIMETPRTAKLLTAEDEIYITLLARGDFNADGIEDLLLKSEWFSRNAFGKHADLLIISKSDKDAIASINWRLKPIK